MRETRKNRKKIASKEEEFSASHEMCCSATESICVLLWRWLAAGASSRGRWQLPRRRARGGRRPVSLPASARDGGRGERSRGMCRGGSCAGLAGERPPKVALARLGGGCGRPPAVPSSTLLGGRETGLGARPAFCFFPIPRRPPVLLDTLQKGGKKQWGHGRGRAAGGGWAAGGCRGGGSWPAAAAAAGGHGPHPRRRRDSVGPRGQRGGGVPGSGAGPPDCSVELRRGAWGCGAAPGERTAGTPWWPCQGSSGDGGVQRAPMRGCASLWDAASAGDCLRGAVLVSPEMLGPWGLAVNPKGTKRGWRRE